MLGPLNKAAGAPLPDRKASQRRRWFGTPSRAMTNGHKPACSAPPRHLPRNGHPVGLLGAERNLGHKADLPSLV
jgi:hypothetical protein